MVKNFGKGGSSHKKMKKSNMINVSTELIFRTEEFQDYGLVLELYGNNRCKIQLYHDKSERLGIIRGNMRKRSQQRIHKDVIVLVALREFENDKVDIVHLYDSTECKSLIEYKEIDTDFVNNNSIFKTTSSYIDEDCIEFI